MTPLRRAVLLPAAVVGLFYAGAAWWPVLTGRAWMWAAAEVSLPEAVAGRDHTEVVRLLRQGADPNARTAMHAVFDERQLVQATPMEAAVAARDEKIIPVLRAYGARVSEADARVLHCLAEKKKVEAKVTVLLPPPPAGAASCEGVPLPW